MNDKKSRLLTKLFDIRAIIAALLAIYGVLLLIAGISPSLAEVGAAGREHTKDATDLAAGSEANLWVGAILLIVAVLFAVWSTLRPQD